MIRVCAATHDSEKALRLFNDLELDGFIEHSKPYNSIIMACASTYRFAPKAIEYWHLMHAKNILPDQVTYVAVLKACAQLGDTQTAYDALQELKLKGLKVNEHIFNQLIRVYAGACMIPNTKDKHL
jgi:pentatricopeptide repeat protein